MVLDRFLHEEYSDEHGRLVLFRCRECGWVSLSLGSLHAHCEGHRGYTRFGIQLPFTSTSIGDFEALMELTEIVAVEEVERVEIEAVDGL